MKSFSKLISSLLVLAMAFGLVPVFAADVAIAEVDKELEAANNNLTEPFDITYEEEVDAGLYPYDEKTVLVKLAKKTHRLDVDGVLNVEYLFSAKDGFWYTVYLEDGTAPKTALAALREADGVVLAEYNFMYQTGATSLSDGEGMPDDTKGNPKQKDQWHLDSCGFQKAWKKIKNDKKNPGGDPGVIVAVIDTGVDYDHEDLKNNIWTNDAEIPGDGIDNDKNGYVDDYYGVNIVARRGNGDDDHGHGTHVAGIIAAANNNVGVVGLAYNTTIMPIKAGQASGYFLQDDVCRAINYARENGADVINMSFGGIASTIAVQDALEAAYTHSVLVAAAGNDGLPNEPVPFSGLPSKPSYPAAYSFVLGVMSVDNYGVESSFTNYDAKAFNSVEYELYAPGNAITSTIPNDKYATWNGTSMAAPIVSAMAAILRSVYDDPDMYPTKFIYGQLASTSERHAECLNPRLHGEHNLPQIANLYDALTKLPKPDVSVSDFATFDSENLGIANNGDGTIDAGELITLGFTLRNRWGMSKDTVVTINALSPANIPNPYVEFSADGVNFGDSASVNYDSVGTYSTQDCGKIIEDDLFVAWENPFYINISKDAPNNTILALNITVTCGNALDDKDKATYTSKATIELTVKNGVVLPQVITEDMTLTKDNYYIIPNSTIIEEGVTVTVTEGTNIQFWTDDSTDPYADQYMASLVVKGTLNCIGTEEEPIKIFPSDLMYYYVVRIYESGNGEINYKYTNITNLDTSTGVRNNVYGFTTAENCEFTRNNSGSIYRRYLSEGKVLTYSYYSNTNICGGKAINCAFYKIGGRDDAELLQVNCDGCIFVDSNIKFSNAYTYENCVFLGNNNYWDSTTNGGTSSMEPMSFYTLTVDKVVRDVETGTAYVKLNTYSTVWGVKKVAEYIGGTPCHIDSEEELAYLKKVGFISTSSTYTVGSNNYYIIEIPDNLFVEKITLSKDSIAVDTSVTYQIVPQIYPSLASDMPVRYFSSNEAVATVDENGLITPVSTGVATVYVFSEDMQVSTSITVNVKDEVEAESIIAPETMQIDIGKTVNLGAKIKPSNSTKALSYESSDNSIITVDADGNITAVAKGEATITVTAANGEELVTAETVVSVVVPVESVKFELGMVYIKPGETKTVTPVITPANATNQKLIWDTSNPDICYVNENGELVGVAEGMVTVKATVENTDLSAYVTVCVSEDYRGSEVVDMDYFSYSASLNYAVTADGALWYWGKDFDSNIIKFPKKLDVTSGGESIDVAQFAIARTDGNSADYRYLILDINGNLYATPEIYYSSNLYKDTHKDSFTLIKENVVKLISNNNSSSVFAIAILEDGSAITLGCNYRGAMGIGGSGQTVYTPVSIAIDGERIVDGWAYESISYLLTESGKLYAAGEIGNGTYEYHTMIYDGVDRLQNGIAVVGDKYFNLDRSANPTLSTLTVENRGYNNNNSFYTVKGRAYVGGYLIPELTNVVKIFYNSSGGWFFLTENNELYSGAASSTVVPTLVPFGAELISTAPALREGDTNLTEVVSGEGSLTGILTDDTLKLGFDASIYNGTNYHNITLTADGNIIAVVKSYDLNNVYFKATGGFKAGVAYVLTIPAGALANDASLYNAAITVSFTFEGDEEIEDIPEAPLPEETPDEPDGDPVHVHAFACEAVMPTLDADGKLTAACECGVSSEVVLPKLTERDVFTAEDFNALYDEFIEKGYNTNVWGSAILNRMTDTDVTKWLRITAPESSEKFGFAGNWWGTTNSELINHQIIDYNDFISLGDINEGEILTVAPENTFPFVVDAYVANEAGEKLDVVSGGKVKFVVKFNRDMDTDFGAQVFFGSTYPYADYEIEGEFTDARTWVGETTLKTVIENGYQFIRVADGRTAPDENGNHLKLYTDWARFGFEIDTTSAMAMTMQGYADDSGIHLEWVQDDYATLAGYNVYRSDKEDGNYVRINKTVIPSDENTFTDTDVEPGKKYYYTFTVVLTDLASESKPAGKITVTAKDTMAPSVYHSPVYTATTGSKVVVSATVSDNIGVHSAKLYYRVKGADAWKTAEMTASNNKYTASVPASAVTLEGVEYYIAAFDGLNYTYAGGHTADNPYEITVYAAVENNAKGDVDGDGNITVLDALKLLRAIYDESLLTGEEFLRADINGDGALTAVEALRILQYANKTISSVLW